LCAVFKIGIQRFKNRGSRKLTAMKVPGKKTMPRKAMVFIEELSFFIALASFWPMNW
jgi:hypothetical protein